jgi:hypothetical protein
MGPLEEAAILNGALTFCNNRWRVPIEQRAIYDGTETSHVICKSS